MKLHLPITLFTALMAVMATLPTAWAKITVKENISESKPEGDPVEITDGTFEGQLGKDSSIKIEKENEEDGDTSLTFKGETTDKARNGIRRIDIDVLPECSFTLAEGGELGVSVRNDFGSTNTYIRLQGGSFTVEEGAKLGGVHSGVVLLARVDVQMHGGEFIVNGSVNDAQGGVKNSAPSSLNVNVQDGGKFIIGENATVGTTYDVNTTLGGWEYDKICGTTTSILIKDTSSFEMKGGKLGVPLSADTDKGSGHTNVSIRLSGDAKAIIWGGEIGGKGVIGGTNEVAEITLLENATLEFKDTANEKTSQNVTIKMQGGRLVGGANFYGEVEISALDTFDMGGLDASRIKKLELKSAGATLKNLKEGSTLNADAMAVNSTTIIMVGSKSSKLVTGESSGDVLPDGKEWLIGFQGNGGNVQLGKKEIKLDFDARDGLLSELLDDEGDVSFEVFFSNAQLMGMEEGENLSKYFSVGAGWGVDVKNVTITNEGCVLTLSGNISKSVWVASKQEPAESYRGYSVEKFDRVVIDKDTTIEFPSTIKQLCGSGNLHLTGNGSAELENRSDAFHHGDTTFYGDITVAEEGNLSVKKTGDSTLTLAGNLKILRDRGSLNVNEGMLILKGDDNVVKSGINVGQRDSHGVLEVEGNLNTSSILVNSYDGNMLVIGKSGHVTVNETITSLSESCSVQVDGELILLGDQDMTGKNKPIFSGTGIISIGDGESETALIIDKDNFIAGSEVSLNVAKGASLSVTGDSFSGNIMGEGKVSTEGTVTLTGDGSLTGEYSGTFVADRSGRIFGGNNPNAAIEAQNGATVKLEAGSTFKSLDAGEGEVTGSNTYTFTDKDAAGSTTRHFSGDIVLRSGNEYDMELDLSNPALWEGSGQHEETLILETGKNIIIEDGATIVLNSIDNLVAKQGDLTGVVLMQGKGIFHESYLRYKGEGDEHEKTLGPVNGVNVKLGGILDLLYERAELQIVEADGGPSAANELIALAEVEPRDGATYDTIVNFYHRTQSKFAPYATSANSIAGSNLLWFEADQKGVTMDESVLAVMSSLQQMADAGDAAGVRKALAAVAGSTLTSLSAAQSAALRNQESRVRDHALQAARLRCQGNDETTQQQRPCKTTHVWVEGTSFFSEQHSRGDESGYRLNSWGGAVGLDAQVDAHWSVGLSLAANYGDLEARAADYAKGDLDSYYVSAWSQAKNGRWGNTLLATVGTNEGDLRRTVNYGSGSYTATSSTSGSSLGAMWEVTYDLYPVKDNKSNIIQPLFNVAVQHTSMDGFSEKNAGGVGLTTEKQTRDTMTLALGLRWLAAIESGKAANRTVTTELHANVAQDMGDRRSEANVALLANPNYTQSVYGARAGSTAFQFGAGVNVPVTANSQLYVNAGGELRSHANAWNAALGVRMGF